MAGLQLLAQTLLLTFLSLLHRLLPYLPQLLSSHIYSLIFTISLAFNVHPPLQQSTTTLKTADHILETHLISTPQIPPTRTIVVIHGLSATAHSDPRILALSRALATAQPHALLLIPRIAPLADCDLSDNPIQLIQHVIQTVANDPTLCPSGKVSVASACISAGFCLVVASKMTEKIQAMFMIGAHASVQNVVQHGVLRRFQGDTRYAWKSVLASFLKPRTKLRDMLVAYVSDDHYRNLGMQAGELDRLLSLYPEEAEEYNRLHGDPQYLERVMNTVLHENEAAFQSMSPLHSIGSFNCPKLVLLHSQSDDIVPCSESILFGQAVRERGGKVTICVTSMLDHGDKKQVGLADLPAVCKLLNAVSPFFELDKRVVFSNGLN